MSGTLKLRCAPGVPAMAVDVMSPDYRVVRRVMLTPGVEHLVEVPSEASFLRCYLPSGRAVTLADPGNLDREITPDALMLANRTSYVSRGSETSIAAERDRRGHLEARASGSFESLEAVRRYQATRSTPAPGGSAWPPPAGVDVVPLGEGVSAAIRSHDGAVVQGSLADNGRDASWELLGPTFDPPFELRLDTPAGPVRMAIPAHAQHTWARLDTPARQHGPIVSIRMQTEAPVADTILNYLADGETAAAGAMRDWASHGESLLKSKMSDPYAAAVGAYLLLRLGDYAHLRDWPRNLADRFPALPDGCVIWAWQLIQTAPSREQEIAEYLLMAAARGLPVYGHGTRLLFDGLTLLGDVGRPALERLQAQVGALVRTSPVTMWYEPVTTGAPPATTPEMTFDVAFGTENAAL